MNRYKYIRNHCRAYEYEYKRLTTGMMKVEDLPAEVIQGILYQMLQQLMDSELSIAKFDHHVEFLDEMLEEYHFEDYMGRENEERINDEFNPLILIMCSLDMAEEQMNEYKKNIETTVKALFERLFKEKKYALEFFGSEERMKKALCLWKKNQLMDDLVNNLFMKYDCTLEVDRIQQIIDGIDSNKEVNLSRYRIVKYEN